DTEPPVLVATPGCVAGAPDAGPISAERVDTCDNLTPGEYVLGLTGMPEGLQYEVCCYSLQGPALAPQAVPAPAERVRPSFCAGNAPYPCEVRSWSPIVAVDRVTSGGPADLPTFTHDVVQGDALLGSGADRSVNEFCDAAFADCALIDVYLDRSS